MTSSEAITSCLLDAFLGREMSRRELLAKFEGMFFPELGPSDQRALGDFARRHFDELRDLADDVRDDCRHLAIFALGFSGDARVVPVLVDRLVAQRDFFDHDYCYSALGQLGSVAHESLYEIAVQRDGEHQMQAVQALGQGRENPLPWLVELARLDPLPEGYFSALYNTHAPEALPVLEIGLWHEDREHRSEALFTAYCLLEMAREDEHPALREIDRTRWGARMLELYADEDLDEHEVALTAIGLLDYEAGLPVVLTALESEETREEAITALRWMSGVAARDALVAVLAHDDRELACAAGASLLQRHDVEADMRARAQRVTFDALFEIEHDSAWCDAAQVLCEDPTQRRALLDVITGEHVERAENAAHALAYWARHEEDDLEELCRLAPAAAQALRKAYRD